MVTVTGAPLPSTASPTVNGSGLSSPSVTEAISSPLLSRTTVSASGVVVIAAAGDPTPWESACVAALLTVLLVVGHDGLTTGFKLQLVIWLWLTVLFGTFAEALAEGRGKAQAASLRATKAELTAKRLKGDGRSQGLTYNRAR